MDRDELPGFAEIVGTYQTKVLAYATRLVGPDQAKDLAQEVFLKVRRSIGSLEDPAKLESWIIAITLNTIRDALRSRPPGERIGKFPAMNDQEDPTAALADQDSLTPEEAAERQEMLSCFMDHVLRLPRSQQAAFLLREVHGLSFEEIARLLALKAGTVRVRCHRARNRIMQELRCNCVPYTNGRGQLMGEPKQGLSHAGRESRTEAKRGRR